MLPKSKPNALFAVERFYETGRIPEHGLVPNVGARVRVRLPRGLQRQRREGDAVLGERVGDLQNA